MRKFYGSGKFLRRLVQFTA